MAREEAIKNLSKETSMEKVNELNYYAGFSRDKVVGLIQEAMEMGAKALEKQDVPDTNVGSKWIPCSERLPEQNGKYLVTAGEGKFPPRVFEYKNDEKLYWENEIGCKPNVDYVKAWQPLPEPYKEGET